MNTFKLIRSQDDLDRKRQEILKRFKEALSPLQANLLAGGALIAPSIVAYNPRCQLLKWGVWYIGAAGIGFVPEEEELIHFMSGNERAELIDA